MRRLKFYVAAYEISFLLEWWCQVNDISWSVAIYHIKEESISFCMKYCLNNFGYLNVEWIMAKVICQSILQDFLRIFFFFYVKWILSRWRIHKGNTWILSHLIWGSEMRIFTAIYIRRITGASIELKQCKLSFLLCSVTKAHHKSVYTHIISTPLMLW